MEKKNKNKKQRGKTVEWERLNNPDCGILFQSPQESNIDAS